MNIFEKRLENDRLHIYVSLFFSFSLSICVFECCGTKRNVFFRSIHFILYFIARLRCELVLQHKKKKFSFLAQYHIPFAQFFSCAYTYDINFKSMLVFWIQIMNVRWNRCIFEPHRLNIQIQFKWYIHSTQHIELDQYVASRVFVFL